MLQGCGMEHTVIDGLLPKWCFFLFSRQFFCRWTGSLNVVASEMFC
jgi:hypothetical protein